VKRAGIIIAVVLLVFCGVGWIAYTHLGDPPDPNTLVISGDIEVHESVVSFQQVQSRIIELPFEEGQFVPVGGVLARVDDSVYRQQVAINESALQVEQEQLESARQSLAAAQASTLAAQADASQKKLDRDHYTTLFSQNATSQDARDLAGTASQQSSAGLLREQALSRAAEENVKVAQDNVRRGEEDLKMAQISLGYTVLRAPFAGAIVARDTEVGEVMPPGAPVLTLADLDHVWMRGYIDETVLGRIRLGQEATVTTDSFPGRSFRGRISFISPEAEFTPKSVETHKERVTLVFRIKIDLDNPQQILKPGMPADAEIKLIPITLRS
jgi:HlyD family secretion protein